jgi:hypothetical protein
MSQCTPTLNNKKDNKKLIKIIKIIKKMFFSSAHLPKNDKISFFIAK